MKESNFVDVAACEAVQEALGFSPLELVFGHGPLREAWLSDDDSPVGLLDYASTFRYRLSKACELA